MSDTTEDFGSGGLNGFGGIGFIWFWATFFGAGFAATGTVRTLGEHAPSHQC
jgi:hypothetical protein